MAKPKADKVKENKPKASAAPKDDAASPAPAIDDKEVEQIAAGFKQIRETLTSSHKGIKESRNLRQALRALTAAEELADRYLRHKV